MLSSLKEENCGQYVPIMWEEERTLPANSDSTHDRTTGHSPVLRIVQRAAAGVKKVATGFVKLGKQRFTVMFIPHSEKRVVNFQINTFAIAFIGLLIVGLIGGFFYLSTVFSGSSRLITQKSEALSTTEASLEAVREEVAEVSKVAEVFSQSLSQTLEGLDLASEDQLSSETDSGGDLSAFLNVREVAPGEIEEIQELENLSNMLEASVRPLEDIRQVLEAQKQLLSDIPNRWPLASGLGRVTMEFGPNIHPVTHQWYLHKGFDIAGSPGIPVVSTANGKVVELGVDPGYGLYIWVRHKYGFRTRYSHLQTVDVSEGEEIFQGQRIGRLGNTGLSTGPHLDFQIWLGTDVVDPSAFLKISNDFKRWSGNRIR
jgi:murein DD-endopeptidase MepM/ murein hydrolase activator NlpD